MSETRRIRLARQVAFGIPALLLGGAYLSQYGFGLYPCEMCWWQRYPHFAALGLALLGSVSPPQRLWLALSGIAILVSAALGGFHAGVEYGWWQGITDCARTQAAEGSNALEAVFAAPLTRCDQAPWSLLGISLAGWNCLISIVAGLAILGLVARRSDA